MTDAPNSELCARQRVRRAEHLFSAGQERLRTAKYACLRAELECAERADLLHELVVGPWGGFVSDESAEALGAFYGMPWLGRRGVHRQE